MQDVFTHRLPPFQNVTKSCIVYFYKKHGLMTKRKKTFRWVLFWLILIIGISDGIRYLRPEGKKEKIEVGKNVVTTTGAKKIILAYNAWGGIVPGSIDFLHKVFIPSSYPCNLCRLTYGIFVMKKEWKYFLDPLPYQKVFLHKDEVRKKYEPVDFPLPAILLSDSAHTKVLMSAAEINSVHSLDSLILIVKNKLAEN